MVFGVILAGAGTGLVIDGISRAISIGPPRHRGGRRGSHPPGGVALVALDIYGLAAKRAAASPLSLDFSSA